MVKGNYHVSLAQRADIMLLSHAEFLANVNPDAARRLLAEFKKISARLSDNPFQFPFADDFDVPNIPAETYRKCFFEDRYKVLFLVEDEDVYIDVIIDCRQENQDII
jgi:plasmid stabilization system protein ParE